MTASFVTLPLLVVLFGATLTGRGRVFLARHAVRIFWAGVALVFAANGYLVLAQYRVWQAGALQQFLLPPYEEDYFFFYAFTRFLASHAISLFFALFLAWLLPRVNRRYGGRFFEKEEPYVAALALFVVGHPGWLFYLSGVLLAYFLVHVGYTLAARKSARLPLYYVWVPAAVFVILIGDYWLSETSLWKLLKI